MTQPASGSAAPSPAPASSPAPAAAPIGAPDGGVPSGGAPPGSAPTGGAPNWLEGVDPDLTQWAGEQGFASVREALLSQRGLMKMKGVPPEQLLRLEPGWEDDPEKSAAVLARLGRPEKPELYEMPDLPVAEGDMDLGDFFRGAAFKHGLSARAAKGVAADFQSAIGEYAAKRTEAAAARQQQEEVALRSEWGGAYDENDTIAGRAIEHVGKVVGLEQKDFAGIRDAIGYSKAMKLFAALGRGFGEHAPIGGEPEHAFGLTPAAATKKMAEIGTQLRGMDRTDPRYMGLLEEQNRMAHMISGEEHKSIPHN